MPKCKTEIRILAVAAALALQPCSALAWTSPSVLNTSTTPDVRFDSSLHVAASGSGTLVSVWCSNTTVGADLGVRLARSTDGGATWGSPIILDSTSTGPSSLDDSAVVAAGSGGTWLAAWSSEDDLGGTVGDDKDILCARSTNDGLVWNAPTNTAGDAATDHAQDYGPAVKSDGLGTWIVAWESYEHESPTVNGRDGDILFVRSTDNGLTWSLPVALNTNAAADSRADEALSLATDGAGFWIAAWQSLHPTGDSLGSDSDILLSVSTDNGSTWSAPVALNSNAASDSGWDMNPQLATSGAGTWIAVWSSNDTLGGTIGADDDILFSRSTDNGVSWTAVMALNGNAAVDGGNDSKPSATFVGGNFMVTWQSTEYPGGPQEGDTDILIAASADVGSTWSSPSPLHAVFQTDGVNDSAPRIASDQAGQAIVAWRTLIANRSDGDMLYSRKEAAAGAADWSVY